jgi:phosphate transport system permease protein
MSRSAPAGGWRYRLRRAKNALLYLGSTLAAALALLPLGLVLYYVTAQGISAINLDFFIKLPKPVGEPGGGMANAIVGSLIIVGLASLVGLPIGILGGIYLAEFGKGRFAWAIRFAADVLSGVPSIVIGILIWATVVVTMKTFSALAGGAALGVMMVPIVMRTTEELIKLVPRSLREASLSLGATHFRTTFRIVLSAAKGGVVTGVLLAVARVSGEAAPLLLTAGSTTFWSIRLDQPMPSLPVQIFTYAIQPYDDWRRQAWAAALVLVSLMLILSAAARYATRGRFRLVR